MKLFKDKGGSKEMLQKIKAAAPKKCLSAYMIFVRETRRRIQMDNLDMPALQIMKEVGKEWQILNHDGRQRFQAKADEDKIRFRREKTLFDGKMKRLLLNPECNASVFDDVPGESSKRDSRKKRCGIKRERSEHRLKKAKDPDAPK
jgi:hypothetical protein